MFKLKRDLIISSVITIILLLATFLHAAGMESGFGAFLNNKWFQLLAASAVQFFAGRRFYKNAFSRLSTGGANVDALIALGASAAFLLSAYNGFIYAAVNGGVDVLYFDSPSALCTLALLGKYLEQSAAARVPDAAKKLMTTGAEVNVVRRGNAGLTVYADEVIPGDIAVVRPGDKIPADGEILSGLTSVDDSMLTGENRPNDKQPGDKVYAPSVCLNGEFEMLVEKTGEDTARSRIIGLLSQSRPDGEHLPKPMNKILAFFIPAAIFISIVTFVWLWLSTGEILPAVTAAVSALIAACPCASGLSAVAVHRIITDKAVESGILFTSGAYLNSSRAPDVILLGKTGVITDGRPEITDIIAFSGFFEEEVISFAASAAKNSAHPLDRAIYGYAQPKVILGGLSENVVRSGGGEIVAMRSDLHGFVGSVPEAETFESLPGKGIRAVVGGREVFVGSRGLFRDNGIDISAHEKILAELENGGKTAMPVAIGRKAAGVIAACDTVNEGSCQAVEKLKAFGLEVYMLTGDSANTAKAIGRQAGIDNVISGVLPGDRAEGINRLKDTGKSVATAGCGASDAQMLATADLGIAAGLSADFENADIVLLRGGLSLAPDAISLSTVAARAIKNSLLLSLACNIAGIPLAAAGLFPLAIMAAAMALSCVFTAIISQGLKRSSGVNVNQ